MGRDKNVLGKQAVKAGTKIAAFKSHKGKMVSGSKGEKGSTTF